MFQVAGMRTMFRLRVNSPTLTSPHYREEKKRKEGGEGEREKTPNVPYLFDPTHSPSSLFYKHATPQSSLLTLKLKLPPIQATTSTTTTATTTTPTTETPAQGFLSPISPDSHTYSFDRRTSIRMSYQSSHQNRGRLTLRRSRKVGILHVTHDT